MTDPTQFSLFGEEPNAKIPEKKVPPPHSVSRSPTDFTLNAPLTYRVRRARRRTIGLTITENGLEVSAPRWVSLTEIESLIDQKRGWIERKLADREAWRQECGIADVSFTDGGVLPFRGKQITLSLGAHALTRLDPEKNQLQVALPVNAEESRIREAVTVWLTSEAKRVIGERYAIVSARAPKSASSWRISGAHAQWGSCSQDGSMRFSWKLIYFEDDVIDYVIAHELAHRVHMNHSSEFWKTVEQIDPDYVRSRAKLKGVVLNELPL